MKGILLRAILFFLPILLIVAVYVWLDPFKVIGLYANYKPSDATLSVPLNQNRVSAGTFLYNEQEYRYNSFIFGSSRSMFYEIQDWKVHLNADASCFHFDASAETIQGILNKIRFLKNRDVSMNNVLLILDVDIFRPYVLLNEHLYLEDPLVVGYSKWLPFQSSHLMSFLDRKFLLAYLDYRVTGEAKPYMSELNLLDDKPFEYDSITNELRYVHFEQLADEGQYYTEQRLLKFGAKRDGRERFSAPAIDEASVESLNEIASILEESSCDVRVVISPLYNQIRMSEADIKILQAVFGADSVFDFSGINELTTPFTGYYERSHYRPHVARAVLDSVYTARPL
jgi:hypothetical protein